MDITTIVYNQFRDKFNTINSHYLTFKKKCFWTFSKLYWRNWKRSILIPISTNDYGNSDDNR